MFRSDSSVFWGNMIPPCPHLRRRWFLGAVVAVPGTAHLSRLHWDGSENAHTYFEWGVFREDGGDCIR